MVPRVYGVTPVFLFEPNGAGEPQLERRCVQELPSPLARQAAPPKLAVRLDRLSHRPRATD
jgi:hypothetical protein